MGGGNQALGLWCGRRGEQVGGGSGFDDAAGVQHVAAGGGTREYGEIVGDEQHGGTGVVHQRGQQVHDLALRDGVECGGEVRPR